MELEEKRLAEMLSEAAARARRNQRRAILYTLLPVVGGILFMFYSAYKVLNLEKKAMSLREEMSIAEARKLEATRDAEMAKREASEAEAMAAVARQKADIAERTLLTAQQSLERIAAGEGDPKRLAKESLQVIVSRRNQTPSNKRWIVIGGDKSLDEARKRVQRADNLGYSNTSIYLRQNSFRTVIEFSSASEANAALSDIRKRLNAGAYIRDLDVWCPDMKDENDYFICQQ